MKKTAWIVISVAFGSFIVRMNNFSTNVSLPTIAQFFGIGPSEVSRIVTGYLLVITSTLLLFGKLSDRIGLKKVFVLGYVVFVLGSFLCGFAHSINLLILFRLLQGTGAAMLLATSYAIISRFLPADRTGSAFGLTSMASALGVAAGAPIGGLIAGCLSWHWVFLINVPVGLVAILIAWRKIPHEDMPRAAEGGHASFDLVGAALSFLGLVLLLGGINRGRHLGWLSPTIMLCIGTALVLLYLFVAREKKCTQPLLDLRFFGSPVFALALAATFFAFFLISGNAFLLPFYLNTLQGLDAKQTGLVLLAYSLVYVFLSPLAGKLSDKVNPAYLCIAAMLSASLCAFTFSTTLVRPGLFFTFLFLIWLGISYVFFFSPNNNQVMRQAPADGHGSVSGLLSTTINLGTVFGVAVFEAVFSYFVPTGGTGGMPQGIIDHTLLLPGFKNAYWIGGIFCAAATLCSFLTITNGKVARRN